MNAIHNFEPASRRSRARTCSSGARSPRARRRRRRRRSAGASPGRDGKCWLQSRAKETVHHILKGGEDSIGALEAIQRVYFNIGSCSEQCWLNHLTDLRQLDPQGRNFGQTPFDIGQCRRDCPNFRAIEDRLPNIARLPVLEGDERHRPRRRARERAEGEEPEGALHAGRARRRPRQAVRQGRGCARTRGVRRDVRPLPLQHPRGRRAGAFRNRDFRALDDKTGLRRDWMGNDQATLVTEVGTNRCRALHSNHMAGHIWQEYGSETLRARTPDPNLREPADGGRGYYRNVSLAERVGARAVHAQQRARAGDLRQAEEPRQLLLPLAVRRSG